MNETLYRLVYVSRNEIVGDEDYIAQEIKNILQIARETNPHLDVTGALMFNSGCFAQILEGPHDNVQEIAERIQCDERHSHVVIIDFMPVETRGFSHWSMAYVGDNANAYEEFFSIAKDTSFDPARLSGERIFDILQEQLSKACILSDINKAA